MGQAAPSLRVMSMSGHDLAASTAENYRAFAAAMRARRTQTNEPARCATLLPALALLPAAGLPW